MLPSIPVSPLIQQSLNCASLLADITQQLNRQQQSHNDALTPTASTTTNTSSSSSSTLEQDAKIQRARLDQLTQDMYAVRAVIFHQWSPDVLAKQIVIVDSQLFCHHDATALNDFHTYLVHSLAHQLIIANSYGAFDHAVRLAHCLSQYRDWNGLMAVVRCLALPAVQRLSTSSASPLCHDFPWVHHDDSTTTTTNDTSFAAYRQALRRSLLPLRPYRFDPQDRRWSDSVKKINHIPNSSSQDAADKDMDAYTLTSNQHKKRQQPNQQQRILVAIPWLPPLLEAESEHDRDLLLTLCRYNRWPAQVDVARSLLLPTSSSSSSSSSTSSASSLPSSPSSTTAPLAAVSSAAMLYSTTSSSLSSLSPLRRNNNLPPILPPHSIVDLLSLGVGDLVVQHWLVSRTYLTSEQLLLSSQLAESDQDARATSRLGSSSPLPPITLPSSQQLVQPSVPPSPARSSASSSASASSSVAVLRAADPETLQQDYDDGQDWRNQTIPYNDDDDDDDDNDDQQVNEVVNEDPWQHAGNRHSLHFIGTNDQLTVTLSPPPPPPPPAKMEVPSISVASSIPLSVTATTMPISQLGSSTMYDGDGDDAVCDDDDDDNDDASGVSVNDSKQDKPATDISLHDTNEISDTRSIHSKHEADEQEDDDATSKVSSLSPPTAAPLQHQHQHQQQQQDDMENTGGDQQAIDDVEIVVATSTESIPAAPIVDATALSPHVQPVSVLTSEPQFAYDNDDDDDERPSMAGQEEETDSEQWTGYPGPGDDHADDDNDDEDDEIWTGYPEPATTMTSSGDDNEPGEDDVEEADSPHRSTPSEASEGEWKGYHATSEEAKWRAEMILKVQQQEWQGYTLETLDEDELDSSTMMNGEFVKSRHARELVNSNNGTSV